ncbi:MAG: choice-of-anchor D domain-containing protein [Bdellovibrio sp.]|nr:choice-of-anchor D domain-containing protein [Bdellovibrio sp.]
MKRLNLFALTALIFTSLISCTPQGKDFATEACVRDNLNCSAPATTIDLVGGDEDRGSVNVDGSGNDVGAVSVKSVRYGEDAVIEFIITNPKLNPLKDFTLEMTPQDAAFEVIDGKSQPSCTDNILTYQEKCSVAIKYKPGKVPPGLVNLDFKFKTITGGDFKFRSAFDPAVLIADFYITPSSLLLPSTMVYSGAAGEASTSDIVIENTSSTTGDDLTIASLKFRGASSCSLLAPSSDACSVGTVLTAKSANTCNIKVGFKPTMRGAQQCLLEIYGTSGTYRTYTFQGMAPGLTASTNQIDFGIVRTSDSQKSKTFTLTVEKDLSSTSANSCSLSLHPADAAFAVSSSPALPGTLAADSQVTVTVTYTPQATARAHRPSVTIDCNSRGGLLQLPLSAATTETYLTSNTNNLNFGDVLVGDKSSQTVTLTNTSSSETLTDLTNSLSQQLGEGFTVTGGTCGASLPPQQSCSVNIEFAPTSAGPSQNNLTSSGSQDSLSPSIAVSGNGAGLSSSQSSVDFGSLKPKSDRPGAPIVITNLASSKAQGCSISAASLKDTGFSIDESSTCLETTELLSEASCEIKPRFTAGTKTGLHEGTLQMSCTKGGSVSIPLKALVTANMKLTIVPPSEFDWQDRLVGVNENIEFTFMNQDSEDLSGLSLSKAGVTSPWAETANTCNSTLAHGSTCKYSMSYAPSAVPGSEQTGPTQGSITAQGSDTAPVIAKFAATAKKISANLPKVDFGKVLTGKTVTANSRFYFINPSSVDVASACTLSSLSTFVVENTDCGSSLEKLGQCSVLVKLPTQASAQTLSESLHYTCVVGGRATVNISAEVTVPLVEMSGDTNFGEWDLDNGALTKTVTITNNSPGSIDLSAPQISGSNAFSISNTTCGSTLSTGATCNISVNFDPSTLGPLTGRVSIIANDDPQAGSYSKSLSGVGTTMALAFSADTLSFDPIRLGSPTTSSKQITITNNGNRTANLSYSSLSSPWSRSGTCGPTLASQASCTLEVTASAYASVAQHNNILTVTETQGSDTDPYTVALSGATWDDALIAIKDNRAQTTYTSSDITLTDITGLPDDANNIVDLSPASRAVVITIKNNRSLAFPLTNLSVNLTKSSGPAADPQEHLLITSDTCSSSTLNSNEECSITVTYTPKAVRETVSKFLLTVTGTDDTFTRTIKALEVRGSSFKGVDLAEDFAPTTHDFGLLSATANAATGSIILSNNGDVSATNLSFDFSGSFTRFATKDNTCASSLSGGGTCTFKLSFDPAGTAVALKSTFNITSTQDSLMGIAELTGASYNDNQGDSDPATGTSYIEHEITSDSTHFFITSKKTNGTTYRNLHLQVCDKDPTTGNINMTSCGANELTVAGEPYWAGAFAGYKLNPQSTDNKILVGSSNQQNDKDANKGISSVLICDKSGITPSNTINFATSCSVINLHSISKDQASGNPISSISNKGAFTSMHVQGTKAIFSAQSSDGFSLTACDYNDTAVPSSALSNCNTHFQTGLGANKAEYSDVAFDGTHIIMAAHNLNAGLYAIACTLDASNQLSCGAYNLVDNNVITDGSNTMLPGAQPYVTIDSAGILIASQQGSEMSQGLRLAKCSLAGLALTCTNKTVAQATGMDGFGLNPSLKVIQRGASRIAWIQSVIFDDYASPSSALKKIAIYNCDITNFGNNCSGVYYQQSVASSSPIYAREMDMDLTKKIITIPFTTGDNFKTGVLTLGLKPEL